MYCRNGETAVIDSRVFEDHVRRRRMCLKCGKRFSTKEILSIPPKRKTLISYDDGVSWVEQKKKNDRRIKSWA